MIEVLARFLGSSFSFNLHPFFSYASTRMLLAAATALVLTIFIGPRFIRALGRLNIGQKVRTKEAPQISQFHEKKNGTPTMGGLLVVFSMLVSLVLWMDLTHPFTLILLVVTVGLSLVGGIDDYLKIRRANTKGLKPRYKIFWQVVIAAFVASYLLVPVASKSLEFGSFFKPPVVKEVRMIEGKKEMTSLTVNQYASKLYIPFFKTPFDLSGLIGRAFLFVFFMFVITGSSNAVNLSDGLDGLATGLLMICAVPFIAVAFMSNHIEIARYLNIAYIEGSSEIAIYLSAFIGALLGFLWYNSPPAQVFMGDIGSLTFGGILGTSAVLLRREFLLALVGGMFVIETLSVILQVAYFRKSKGKRLFLCAPIHHHFECKGLADTKVVIRFWIIALLLAIIGVLSLKLQ